MKLLLTDTFYKYKMITVSKKNKILIPKNISTIYCDKKKILVLIGAKKQKSIKIPVKIFIEKNDYIKVSSIPFLNIKKNKIKAIRGTTVAYIKQAISEVLGNHYNNLKFKGLGYRALLLEDFDNKLILLKLGYSHTTYFKIPNNFKIVCFKKFTDLFITGSSYKSVNQISSSIRNCKIPEPYKGKGITYVNEKVTLKQGKKI